MKRIAFILAMVIFLAACANSQAIEIIESPPEIYTLIQNLAESKVSEPAEFLLDVRPHHHGSFDEMEYIAASRIFDITEFEVFAVGAPNIVRGRMGDDARIIMHNNLPLANIVSFEVFEVIEGDITVGETIRIKEPYYIENGTFFTWNNYHPSIPHQEYVFFLDSAATASEGSVGEAIGAFWTFHGERSRHPVPINAPDIHAFSAATQDFGTGVFGLGSGANVEVYMQLWEDVMNEWVAAGE